MTDDVDDVSAVVAQLAVERAAPVVLYRASVAGDTVPVLYECLRTVGWCEHLNLVLVTGGGSVTVARQIALLLREFTGSLSILVPHQARSAGTLLCLSADELVLGPLAELGPIDSQMGSEAPPATGQPGTIATEDLRLFPEMARDWFGVDRPEDRLQVLALVAQRLFPTSLSAFYRFDKLVRCSAEELLALHLVSEEQEGLRANIVTRLVEGCYSHDSVLCRGDVRTLGLPVVDATPLEETLIWALAGAGAAATGEAVPGGAAEPMIVGAGFVAHLTTEGWQTE